MKFDGQLESGGNAGRFPSTRHSVVLAARSTSPDIRREALDVLATAYWQPVLTYLSLRWHLPREEAEDLTQGFFARALERELFARFDPARARLRTYLRLALDAFVANEHRAAHRLKRGGGAELVSLDSEEAVAATPESSGGGDAEQLFRHEWVRALFESAVSELRANCETSGRQTLFAIFERYDLNEPGCDGRVRYADLALEFGIPVTQVTNHLAWTRAEFRRLVLRRLQESTGTDEEFRAEARDILGVDPL